MSITIAQEMMLWVSLLFISFDDAHIAPTSVIVIEYDLEDPMDLNTCI
jgi:hypothetical protein